MTAHAHKYWKNDLDDLRARAADIETSPAVRRDLVSPRECARVMLGVVSYVQRAYSLEEMQASCADLARDDRAWKSSLRDLPSEGGIVKQSTFLIAVTCAGLLGIANEAAIRSALAFWATETDPSTWQTLLQ